MHFTEKRICYPLMESRSFKCIGKSRLENEFLKIFDITSISLTSCPLPPSQDKFALDHASHSFQPRGPLSPRRTEDEGSKLPLVMEILKFALEMLTIGVGTFMNSPPQCGKAHIGRDIATMRGYRRGCLSRLWIR